MFMSATLTVYSFDRFSASSGFFRLLRHRRRILLDIFQKNGRFLRLQNLLPQKLEGFADFAELSGFVNKLPCSGPTVVRISSNKNVVVTSFHPMKIALIISSSAVFKILILLVSEYALK